MLVAAFPYFAFLAITMLAYSLQQKSKSQQKVSVAITYLCMVLFAGLRNQTVGTDTMSYVRAFYNVYNRVFSEDIIKVLLDEPGYYYLELFARQFSDNYWVILCTISGLCYALVLYSISKHSENRLFSLFIYITLGYYTFCFNAARQAIALSVYLLALPCLYNRRFIHYCILVCVAALFHKTVLIAIPLYFLFVMKYSWKSLSLVIVAAVLISNMLPSFLNSAAEMEGRYMLYSTVKATGGYLLTLFYVIMAVFFILMRKDIMKDHRKEYDIYLQMLICGSVIYVVVSLTGSYVELTRFAAYFQIASIFLFAKIYNSNIRVINPIFMGTICVGCLIFFYIFITTMAALVPYSFNQHL